MIVHNWRFTFGEIAYAKLIQGGGSHSAESTVRAARYEAESNLFTILLCSGRFAMTLEIKANSFIFFLFFNHL